MASVFLSYDREDATRARSVAQALEKAGHSVWWDRDIAGGAQYGTEIEEALKRSEAVVVLWSSAAVQSAWVRDEAAAGRDAGKLVPASIDAAVPPMGFRQYQTIDLSGWKGGRGTKAFGELNRAVNGLLRGRTGPIPAVDSIGSKQTPNWLRRGVLAAVILAVLVGGGWLVMRMARSPAAPVVTVATADNSAASRQLARDLFVKLGTLQTAGVEGMQLVGPGDASATDADFVFEIGSVPNSAASANLVLFSGDSRALVWSKDFSLPANRQGDLKEQAAFTAARVLGCALEIREAGSRIDQRLTKLYLEGCSMLAEFTGAFLAPALPAFREVTRKVPDFEEGWSKLLLTEAEVANYSAPTQQDLRRHVTEVRERFPDNAAAFYAEVELLPRNATVERLELTQKAVEKHPDHPFLLHQRAILLFEVGRVSEAIDHAQQAAESDPLSARTRSNYIALLAYAGRFDRASRELEKGEKLWPGSFAMLDASSRVHARFGDPKKALAIARSGVFGSDNELEAFLLARIDPTPANIEKAIAANMTMFGRDDRALGYLMQTLGEFGREQQLFDFLSRQRGELMVSKSVLFRAPLRNFRRDPRFMQVARRFGLVDYWRSSGKWPDFCFEADLPYDCKAEAAKLN